MNLPPRFEVETVRDEEGEISLSGRLTLPQHLSSYRLEGLPAVLSAIALATVEVL